MIGRWTIAYSVIFLAMISSLNAQITQLDEGVRLFREGRLDQALVKLEQAHRIAPRNATIENLLGITETELGHFGKAANHYRNAIHLDPTQAAPHRNLGFNLLTARDFVDAEPELREAVRLDPTNNFAHYYLLLVALSAGHDAEAVEQASHAGKLPDNDAEAVAGLVEAQIRMGSADEAMSRLDHFEQTNALSSAKEYEIAILLSGHAFYHQAVRCFRRIASLDPTWENRYNLS
jgi:tetratricopeptide (TPR) repeat protein